jgi:mono/diheme cytochrome c family protein
MFFGCGAASGVKARPKAKTSGTTEPLMRSIYNAFDFAAALCFLICVSAIALAQDQALIEAGEQIYDENCASCHGEKLRNTGTTFDLRKLRADGRPRFNKFVMEGKGQMPPWQGTLNDEQVDQLWAYIRAHAYEK